MLQNEHAQHTSEGHVRSPGVRSDLDRRAKLRREKDVRGHRGASTFSIKRLVYETIDTCLHSMSSISMPAEKDIFPKIDVLFDRALLRASHSRQGSETRQQWRVNIEQDAYETAILPSHQQPLTAPFAFPVSVPILSPAYDPYKDPSDFVAYMPRG